MDPSPAVTQKKSLLMDVHCKSSDGIDIYSAEYRPDVKGSLNRTNPPFATSDGILAVSKESLIMGKRNKHNNIST
jgi:hypothetical protein